MKLYLQYFYHKKFQLNRFDNATQVNCFFCFLTTFSPSDWDNTLKVVSILATPEVGHPAPCVFGTCMAYDSNLIIWSRFLRYAPPRPSSTENLGYGPD